MNTVVDHCALPELMTVEKAIEKILSSACAVGEDETVDIFSALNRVLAEDVISTIDVPGYDNSAMDGYAVSSNDCQAEGAELPVMQRIPAGSTGTRLEPGTAARIFTGAPVPDNADAVIMQELCEAGINTIKVNCIAHEGENIRRAGEDIAKDSQVLAAGHHIKPQDMGLIASVGCAQIKVKRKIKVGVFFTGDEIVTPGEPLAPGQIYNSNRYTLRGLLDVMNCEVVDLGIVPDTLEGTKQVLQDAASQSDLVITSGGVSVGEEDYVRIALEQLGELSMWRIAMKPGKPVAFGKIGNALFLGLPGNPVSVFVTFLIFARPLILKMQGSAKQLMKAVSVTADFNWPAVVRQEFLRVQLINDNGTTKTRLFPEQGSGVLSSASWADGLAIIPVGKEVKCGDQVSYLPFYGLM